MPTLTSMFGYFPGKRLRLLEDLPAGVAYDWANRIHPNLWWSVTDAVGRPDVKRICELGCGFEAIAGRGLAIRRADDPFSTRASADRLLALFKNCDFEQLVVSASAFQDGRAPHFAYFRPAAKEPVWEKIVNFMRA